jgi:hypothetical protein
MHDGSVMAPDNRIHPHESAIHPDEYRIHDH